VLGVIPAAGVGSRMRPLAFSKELLPVGTRVEDGRERPRAVSEYLVERLIEAGADRLCFVISPGKADIVSYFGGRVGGVPIAYVVQESPDGLCDALFRALPFAAATETIAVGLPDTVWFPADGLRLLPDDRLSFLLFPVTRPELFDAVVTDDAHRVQAIEVKVPRPSSHWVWGAWKAPARVMAALHGLWVARDRQDQYIGTLVNEYLRQGGQAIGVPGGRAYVDTGTVEGYREALTLLQGVPLSPVAPIFSKKEQQEHGRTDDAGADPEERQRAG
jgi:dTDP-glucose pyrophosphorylase